MHSEGVVVDLNFSMVSFLPGLINLSEKHLKKSRKISIRPIGLMSRPTRSGRSAQRGNKKSTPSGRSAQRGNTKYKIILTYLPSYKYRSTEVTHLYRAYI